MFPNKSVTLKTLLSFSLLVSFLTTMFDFIFHTFLTTPEETPLYFAAKFGNAFIASLLTVLIPSVLLGALVGAITFSILVGVYYYAAYLLQIPALSCCTIYAPHINGLPYATYFTLGYLQVTNDLLGFILVHFLAYFASFLIISAFIRLKR